MPLQTMYPAKLGSPKTTLAANLAADATTMVLADASVLPDGPNIAVLGSDENCEIVSYTSIDISNNTVSGLVRAQGGSAARVWEKGIVVARNSTSLDHDTFIANIGELNTLIGGISGKYIDKVSYLDHVDLNSFTASGMYPISSSISNAPATNMEFIILFVLSPRSDIFYQTVFHQSGIYYRRYSESDGWGNWNKLYPSQWGNIQGALANQTDLTAAFAGKQDVLMFDSTPTASSGNPVTSGGIKTALDGKSNSNHSHSDLAPINSPSFTGTPTTAASPAVSDDSKKLATTAFVQDVMDTGFRNVYKVTLPNVSNSKRTFTAAGITANHVMVVEGYAYLSNPSAICNNLSITTGANSVSITGTMTGTTNIIVTLGIPRSITAS